MKKFFKIILRFFIPKKYWYVVYKMEAETADGTQNFEMSVVLEDIHPFAKLLELMGKSGSSKSISLVNHCKITEKEFHEFNARLAEIMMKQTGKPTLR